MIWNKRSTPKPAALASFPHYVIEKIVPTLDASRHNILNTARKRFQRGMDSRVLTQMLLHFGRDSAMFASLAFSSTLQNITQQPTSDIEYGDCYLAALFCLTRPLDDSPETAIEALSIWAKQLQNDAGYLVFANQSQIDDLCEVGWERFEALRSHKDAILPLAYMNLLSQIVRHRRQGHDMPYKYLDAMLSADPIVFASIEHVLGEKVAPILNNWIEVLLQVQTLASQHDEEFWTD